MKNAHIFSLILFTLSSQAFAQENPDQCYDEDRIFKHCQIDQSRLFDDAMARAKKQNKKLILVVGYDKCPWSRAIMNMFQYSSASDAFNTLYNFRTIAYTGGLNDFLTYLTKRTEFKNAEEFGFPYLIMVDPKTGKTATSKTGNLENNYEIDGVSWSGHSLEKVTAALLHMEAEIVKK